MPRKRTNQEPARKRSRNGCDRCRVRKIACDETKPVCKQCQAKAYDCQTTVALKWETDYVGKAFGRTGVYKKNTAGLRTHSPYATTTDNVSWRSVPYISAYSFINTTTSNVEELVNLPNCVSNSMTRRVQHHYLHG